MICSAKPSLRTARELSNTLRVLEKLTIAVIEGVSQTVPKSYPRSEPSGRNVSLILLITTFVTLVCSFKQLKRLISPAQIVFIPRQFTNSVMLN